MPGRTPERIDQRGQRCGEVRLEATAIGHVGHEHEALDPVAYMEGDDPRQRSVRGHGRACAVGHDREAEEESQDEDEKKPACRGRKR